jgi:hypothetical protein
LHDFGDDVLVLQHSNSPVGPAIIAEHATCLSENPS